jgi:hypothetical protein
VAQQDCLLDPRRLVYFSNLDREAHIFDLGDVAARVGVDKDQAGGAARSAPCRKADFVMPPNRPEIARQPVTHPG